MRSLVFIAFLVAGAFSKPLESEEDDKILQGYACYKRSVLYHVSLRVAGRHFCAGSLIADQWVLTSAQCFRSNIQVVLGEYDMKVSEVSEQYIDVYKAIRHPYFNSRTLDNDIMLIKLTQKASMNYIQKVSLPSYCVGTATSCLVSGWGHSSPNDAYPSSTLQCLDSPTVSDYECINYYPGRITQNMFCAGRVGDSTTCKGDEGGPLVCQDQLQGIVSWGDQCDVENNPWVYTKICNFIPWIKSTMKNN